MRVPVNSPWAPAMGWRLTWRMPAIPASNRSSSKISSNAPWHKGHMAGAEARWGCSARNPGCAATASAIFGLYFMVQDPSG